VGKSGQKLDVEDSAAASFKLDNGTLGTLTSAYFTDTGYNSHIKIWGSEGWIQMDTYTPGLDPTIPLTWYSHATGEVQSFVVDPSVETGYTPWGEPAFLST
jgi:predicted dehydrogenase